MGFGEKLLYVGVFDIDELIGYCSGFPSSKKFIGGLQTSERKGEENKYVFGGFRKVNPYVKLEMEIELYWLMKNHVDVKKGDKTTEMVRGKLKAKINIEIKTDYKENFATDKASKNRKKVYEKSIESEMDKMEDRCVDIYLDWVSNVKRILNTIIQ